MNADDTYIPFANIFLLPTEILKKVDSLETLISSYDEIIDQHCTNHPEQKD
jgi:hypothetical protein